MSDWSWHLWLVRGQALKWRIKEGFHKGNFCGGSNGKTQKLKGLERFEFKHFDSCLQYVRSRAPR